MRFLPDRRLYVDTDLCLEWLDGLPPSGRGGRAEDDCHVYWHGPIGPKQTLVLKSFLATQDVGRLRLTLWLDGDGFVEHEGSTALLRLRPHLRVRLYDPVEQSRGTPLEDRLDLYTGPEPTARSNFARLTILHNAGGIYVDTDSILLRDLYDLPFGIFGSDEFCTQWSSRTASGNNAFFRLRRGSPAAVALMERAARANSCRSRAILAFEGADDVDLLVLPSAFFDPLWAQQDGADRATRAPIRTWDEFFTDVRVSPLRRRARSFGEFFRGAFAYHWHNRWDVVEEHDSYFARFHRELDALLAERECLAAPAHHA